MSKEHVWPRWVRALLPHEALADPQNKNIFEDSVQGEWLTRERQHPFNITVKGICRSCNNGWMSQTEEEVRPFIEGMLVGRGRALHSTGQARIAKWGYLKALVAQRAFDRLPASQVPVPDGDYALMYEHRSAPGLPDFLTAYTAKSAWSLGSAPYGFFRLNGIARADREHGNEFDGYVTTFSVLDLVLTVLRLGSGERGEFIQLPYGQRLQNSVRQIWPVMGSIQWPPGPPLTHRGILALAGGGD